MSTLLILLVLVLTFILVNKKSTFVNIQRVHIVSFSYNCCRLAQENLERSAKMYGATNVYSLTLDTLDAPEHIKEQIRTHKRGAGYWVWKPYAIKQVLNQSNPDDIIIYVDSSTYFNKPMENIINFINKNGVLAFKHGFIDPLTGQPHYQRNWTKMDAVSYFGYLSDWCSKDGLNEQLMAGFIGIKNNAIGKDLINYWLESLQDIHLYDDTPSILPNCQGFTESRHDQQMLSMILYKTGIQFPDYNKEFYGWIWHEKVNGQNRHL